MPSPSDLQQILDDVTSLPEDERREVLAELLRMTRELDQPNPTEDALLAAAEEVLRRGE